MTPNSLHAHPESVPDIPLVDLYTRRIIGTRTYNVLTANGYLSLRQVAGQPAVTFLRMINFGRYSLREIEAALSAVSEMPPEDMVG